MIVGSAVPTTVWSRAEEDGDHDRAEDAHADGVGELDRRAIRRSDPCLCLGWTPGHLSLVWA